MTWPVRSSAVPARTSSPSNPTPTSTSGSTLSAPASACSWSADRRLAPRSAACNSRRLRPADLATSPMRAPVSSRTARSRVPMSSGRMSWLGSITEGISGGGRADLTRRDDRHPPGQGASGTQRFSSSPMCPMTVRTTWPGARYVGGRMPWPTPAGVPVRQQVAGLQGHELTGVGDQVGRREHQLRGVAGLTDHAVDLAADLEVGVGTAHLVGRDQPRPDRRGVLPGLALQPLERAVLPVAHGHVVGDGEPGDGVGGLGAGCVPDAAADHQRQLRLPVDLMRRGRQHDVVVSAPIRASRNLANNVGCVGSSWPISRMWLR